jgi:hypothetical protein
LVFLSILGLCLENRKIGEPGNADPIGVNIFMLSARVTEEACVSIFEEIKAEQKAREEEQARLDGERMYSERADLFAHRETLNYGAFVWVPTPTPQRTYSSGDTYGDHSNAYLDGTCGR